jgi:putative hydrolase of the HAD superfamily
MTTRDPAIRAVLFDAVGTLILLREPIGATYSRMAREFGVRIPAARVDSAFHEVFRRMPPMAFADEPRDRLELRERGWWRELVGGTFRTADANARFTDFERYFDGLFRHFAASRAWRTAPGAHQTLTALRARGVATGVVSNFDHRLPALLQGLSLRPLLDIVVLPRDVGATKPDARLFHAALARLDVSASQALYVGDDVEHDIAGARAAGLQAVDVATLPSLLDLLNVIDGRR